MNFEQFVSVILEKDNRQKILKIGMPQDVADYLHNMSNKYSLWFADKINKMPEYQASKDKIRFIHNLQTQIQNIIDWIRGEQNVNINIYDWQNALEKATEYHDRLTVTHKDKETNTIIKEYPDGFYWVDIESTSDSCERSSMGHCASTSKGDTLYSLRKYNKAIDAVESFITIAISPDDGIWYQCKGRKNSKPKQEYYPYIVDILIYKNVFQFKTEYDSRNDFKAQDFKQYLEENPNVYPNTDELIEKIDESTIGFDDFEKILDEYQTSFKYFGIMIDSGYGDDEDSSLYLNYNFFLSIKKIDTSLPIDCLELKYNSKAISYFNNIIDVHLSDVNVEDEGDEIRIYGSIEDSDGSFSFDEQGLKAFERQCEYYKQLNEKFDYDEFIKEHLEKILVLDGCLETEITNFDSKIKEQFDNFYAVKMNDKTLDLQVRISDNNRFKIYIDKNSLSYFSVLHRGYSSNDFGLPIPSIKNLKNDYFFTPSSHSDILLFSFFWNFIKNNILNEYSQRMRIYYDSYSQSFNTVFNYSYEDEQTDYNKELKYLKILRQKSGEINKALIKFITEVFVPFVNNKKTFGIDDFEVFKTGYNPKRSEVRLKERSTYIGTFNTDEITPEFLQKLAKEKNLDSGYKNLDEEKVQKWLESNIDNQLMLPSFKDFFESRSVNYK